MPKLRNRNAEIELTLTVGDIETILWHLGGLTGHPQSISDRLAMLLADANPRAVRGASDA